MSTDANFDVSLDYNTLVTEIDALVDINSKCYELLGAICNAADAAGMLDSGYLIINAFNTVNDIINGPIRDTTMNIMSVESLFNIFQNQDFYTDYFSNVDKDGDGNLDIDYEKLLTVMVSLVNTHEECSFAVANYDEVLEKYSVMLKDLKGQLDFFQKNMAGLDLNDTSGTVNDYVAAYADYQKVKEDYDNLVNIMSIVKSIRDYTFDKDFCLYGSEEDFEALSGDVPVRIATYKMVTVEGEDGFLFGDTYIDDIEFYDKDGNLLSDVSAFEASMYFASRDLFTNDVTLSDGYWSTEYSRAYKWLNDQEKKIANYLYNSGNLDKLEDYLEFKGVEANKREGALLAQDIISKIDGYYKNVSTDSDKDIAYVRTLGLLATNGFGDGLASFVDGFNNLLAADGKLSADQYKTMEIINALNSKDEGAIGNLFENKWYTFGATASYEVFNSIGNMVPSMAISALTASPTLGSTIMALSSAGNAREQGLQAGMTDLEAWQYGILSGASEGVTEYILGGIPYLSSADELTDLLKNPIINKMIDANPNMLKFFNSGLYRFGENMVSEGIEEMFQTGILEPTITALVTGEIQTASLEEVLKSGIYGMASSGITQGTVNTGKGILNLAVNHSLTNGPTIILDDNGYSMRNMSNEFINDFVKKYGNQDLSDESVLEQVKAELAPYMIGAGSSTETSNVPKTPSETINPNVPAAPSETIRPNASSTQQASAIVEAARTVIEEQGGTLPNETSVVIEQEYTTNADESFEPIRQQDNIDRVEHASEGEITSYNYQTNDSYEEQNDSLNKTEPMSEEFDSDRYTPISVASDAKAEDLTVSVADKSVTTSGNVESSDTQDYVMPTISGVTVATALSQGMMTSKENIGIVVDGLSTDSKIEVDDGSELVRSEFDLSDGRKTGVETTTTTTEIADDVSHKITSEEGVSDSILVDAFLHDTSSQTTDNNELSQGDVLDGKIGIQFFATPKTNSGTVVDGISTDLSVHVEDATGTVSDAITIDSESREVSIDTTTPRNILIDGKNFIVKMCSEINNFISAKQVEIKLISELNKKGYQFGIFSIINESSDNILKFVSPKLIIKAINSGKYSCTPSTPASVKLNFEIVFASLQRYLSEPFAGYDKLNEIDYSIFSKEQLKSLADMIEQRIGFITDGTPNSNLTILFDYVVNNYDHENYPNLMEVAICYCSQEVFKQNISSCESILSSDKFYLMQGCPNYSSISEIIVSNPKKYLAVNVERAVNCHGVTIYEEMVADIVDVLKNTSYVLRTYSPDILKRNHDLIIKSISESKLVNELIELLEFVDFSGMSDSQLEEVISLLETKTNYTFSQRTPKILVNYVINKGDSSTKFFESAMFYCDSEVLIDYLNKNQPVIDSDILINLIDGKSLNEKVIVDYVIKNAPDYLDKYYIMSSVIKKCDLKVLRDNVIKLLPFFEDRAKSMYDFNVKEFMLDEERANIIIESAIINAKSCPNFVSTIIEHCSEDVLKANIDGVVDALDMVSSYHFTESKNSIVIADAIISYASDGQTVHCHFFEALDICSHVALESNIETVLNIINNNKQYFYLFNDNPNSIFIADSIVSMANNETGVHRYLSKAINACSPNVLKANIDAVINVLGKTNYSFILDNPNSKYLANAVVLWGVNQSSKPQYFIRALNYCSTEVLKDNIDSILKYLNDNNLIIDPVYSNFDVVMEHAIAKISDYPRLVLNVINFISEEIFVENIGTLLPYVKTLKVSDCSGKLLNIILKNTCSMTISNTEINLMIKSLGSNYDVSFVLNNPKTCCELCFKIVNTNSSTLSSVGISLLPQLLESNNPIESFEKIEKVFCQNNIPLFGKQFLAFQILYPDLNFNFNHLSKLSPQLIGDIEVRLPGNLVRTLSANEKRFVIIYNDLLRIAIRSNNPFFREYLMNIDRGNSLFLSITSGNLSVETLDSFQKRDLEIFVDHLEALYANTKRGKKDSVDFSKFTLTEKLEYFASKFRPNDKYDLRDKIVTHFAYSAGYTRFDDILHDMNSAILEADARGRQYARELGSDGRFMFDVGDFVRGIGDYRTLGSSLDSGNVSREFLTVFCGVSCSDFTPLDIDFSRISLSSNVRDAMNMSLTGDSYGDVCLIIKNNNPHFNISRENDIITASKYEPSKAELFSTLNDAHWGVRTGISLTDVDYILYNGPQFNLNSIKFEIARHGFYIPVINDDGALIFTVEEYEALRGKMSGLSYYGISDYDFSATLDIPNVEKIVSSYDENAEITRVKREKIENLLQTVFSSEDFRLKMSRDITGDLVPGTVELIDTGSTGRGTNSIGGGDFDFLLRVDQQLIVDSEKFIAFKESIENLLCSFPYDISESRIDIDAGDFRLKGVQIDADTVVDIDISIVVRTEKINYSSDMCLRDRLNTMKDKNPIGYRYAIANIIEAKRVLKAGHVYKPFRSDSSQGGLGGIGIENWVLQHGGSFVEAAESFVQAALGDDWRTSGNIYECNWDAFKSKYSIWDFGQNHFTERKNPGSYLFDEFIDRNMSPDGYSKMVEVLRNYLLDYYDSGYEGKDVLNMSNGDDSDGSNIPSLDSATDDGELLQPGEILAKKIGFQYFARPKGDLVVESDVETPSLDLDIVVDDGSETVTSEFDLEDISMDDDFEVESVGDNVDVEIDTDTVFDEDDGYELRPGESLASRIGIQFFATPKTNSGTVVDGISTDLSVHAEAATGTVSDAITIDSESGEVSVDTTIPRNILVDGKNFVVKMGSEIKNFISARQVEIKLLKTEDEDMIEKLVAELSDDEYKFLSFKTIKKIYLNSSELPIAIKNRILNETKLANYIVSEITLFDFNYGVVAEAIGLAIDNCTCDVSIDVLNEILGRSYYEISEKTPPAVIAKIIDNPYIRGGIGDALKYCTPEMLTDDNMTKLFSVLRSNESYLEEFNSLSRTKFANFVINSFDISTFTSSDVCFSFELLNYCDFTDSVDLVKVCKIVETYNNIKLMFYRKSYISLSFAKYIIENYDSFEKHFKLEEIFSDSNAAIIADIIISAPSLYPKLVEKAVDYCSLEVLETHLFDILPFLDNLEGKMFNLEIQRRVSDIILEKPNLYPRLVNKAIYYCSDDLFASKLDDFIAILSDSFYFISSSPHAEIIANKWISSSSISLEEKFNILSLISLGKLDYQSIKKYSEVIIPVISKMDLGIILVEKHELNLLVMNTFGSENLLKLCSVYGRHLSNLSTFIEENCYLYENDFLEFSKKLEEFFVEECYLGNIVYSPVFAPDFLIEKHPDLFLDESAPKTLKELYYGNRYETLTFELLAKNKEWLPYLEGKSIAASLLKNGKLKSELLEYFSVFGEDTAIKLGISKPETVIEIMENHQIKLMKSWYDKTGCRFIPDYVIMNILSLEDADKFLVSGVNWNKLMKLKLFSKSYDSRAAMLKLAYSFGVFDHDQKGFSNVYNLLTYIPRKLDSVYATVFETIENEITYIINIMSNSGICFDDNMTVELFIDYINEYCKTNYLESEKFDKLLNLLEAMRAEMISVDFRKNIFAQLYRVNDNGSYTLTINPEKSSKTALAIRAYLDEFDELPIITTKKAVKMFGYFELTYDTNFRDFLLKNIDKVIKSSESIDFISDMQRQFSDISVFNAGRKLTWEMAVDYLKAEFKFVNTGNEVAAKLVAREGRHTQSQFNVLQQIYNIGKQRTFSSIPRVKGTFGDYTYEMLRLDDPLALIVGNLTNCCQRLDDVGQQCMEHSMVDNNGRIFVVRDKNGEIIAQSWVWRNKDVLCFDNIEIPEIQANKRGFTRDDLSEGLIYNLRQFTDGVLDVYKHAAFELMEIDQKVFEKLLAQEKITSEQYEGLRLRKITTGKGHSKIVASLGALKYDLDSVRPKKFIPPINIGRSFYTNDSVHQYIIIEEERENSFDGDNLLVHRDIYDEYIDDVTDSFVKQLRNLEKVTKGSFDKFKTVVDKTSYTVAEITENYGLNPETTRVILHPNFAIIYDVNDGKLKIGDLFFNTHIDNGEQQMNIEDKVVIQIRLALDQIETGLDVDISSLNEKQQQMYFKAINLDKELDMERGIYDGE